MTWEKVDKTLDKNTGFDGTHQERINNTRLLVVVGHNATDEGRLSGHQHVDQVVQLVAEVGSFKCFPLRREEALCLQQCCTILAIK